MWQIFFSYQTLLCRDEGVGGEQSRLLTYFLRVIYCQNDDDVQKLNFPMNSKFSLYYWMVNSTFFVDIKPNNMLTHSWRRHFPNHFEKMSHYLFYKRKIKEAIFFQSKKHISEFFTLTYFFSQIIALSLCTTPYVINYLAIYIFPSLKTGLSPSAS